MTEQSDLDVTFGKCANTWSNVNLTAVFFNDRFKIM